MAEALVTGLGAVLSKALVRLWFKNSDWIEDVVDVAASAASGSEAPSRQRLDRTLKRELERLEEVVADRLAPMIAAEFPSLPDNEASAAILAVATTLDKINGLEEREVARVDADPTRLRHRLIELDPDRARRDSLSTDSAALYVLLLRECSNYLVALTRRLSSFEKEALVQILQRETDLLRIAQETLDRVPEGRATGSTVEQDKLQYFRDVARRLDVLEIFGAGLSASSRRYTMSLAWVDLTVSQQRGERVGQTVTVQTSLELNPRLILRGPAGSGKSTFLAWLAVALARQRLESPLAHLNGLTPIYVQMRKLRFQSGPPRLEDIMHLSSPLSNQYIDGGSFEKDGRDGRLAFLLDGLDEVSADARAPLLAWVQDVLERYPACPVVLSSRPLAVGHDWLELPGFAVADLLPLSPEDVRTLVRRWHRAQGVATRGRTSDTHTIDSRRSQLLAHLEANPTIRDIAGTPLLCALLCALNMDWAGQLPRDRMQLYNIALEMLIERRDQERGVPRDVAQPLTFAEAKQLLRELAWWMTLNGISTIRHRDYRERIGRAVPHLPRVELPASEVADALLARSGVLREPEHGRIDFVHRSFQEYLAALEAVESDHVGLLVERASDAAWYNVIAMACGHANSVQRSALVRGLLEAGDRTRTKRKIPSQHVVAAMGLDYTVVIDPELAQAVQSRLEDLVPPHSVESLGVLVSSGDVAARLIGQWVKTGRSEEDVVACIGALRQIPSEASMQALHQVALAKQAPRVVEALLKAGTSFPRRTFADRVFRGVRLVPPTNLRLTREEARLAELVDDVGSYDLYVTLDAEDSASDAPGLLALPKARSIEVDVVGARDLSSLPSTVSVRSAIVRDRFQSLESLFGLHLSPRLQGLTLHGMKGQVKLAVLDLPELRSVVLGQCGLAEDDKEALEGRGVRIALA